VGDSLKRIIDDDRQVIGSADVFAGKNHVAE